MNENLFSDEWSFESFQCIQHQKGVLKYPKDFLVFMSIYVLLQVSFMEILQSTLW